MKTEDLIFYEIYPRSFCDSNQDGIGDFQGVLSKIPYLQELGVNAVWIAPCFQSPNKDNGYDVSDYLSLQNEYGSMRDFEKMLKAFHEAGMIVILDFVANHTSTEHRWFRRSRSSKKNPYREYYIWRKQPNDWKSVFGGDAWEYDEKTKEYYLHSFAVEQADLNWENPKVREEMRNVLSFWLKKGVDGFRCDMLDMIAKEFDEKNGGGALLHDYIRELFEEVNRQGSFTVGECWTADGENASLFCGKDREELTTVFAFQHLCVEDGKFPLKKPSLQEVCGRISNWQTVTQKKDVIPTVFLENHDQPRAVSRFGDDRKYRYESATMLATLTLLHRGIPFLFQGQEIGITNSFHADMADFDDVEEWNYFREKLGNMPREEILRNINADGRDNARRMMPWNETQEKSWIAPYSRQAEINVKKDRNAEKSVFSFYQKLIALRKEKSAFRLGRYELIALTKELYAFQRTFEKERYAVVCAFENGGELPNELESSNVALLLSNGLIKGNCLSPYEARVYRLS